MAGAPMDSGKHHGPSHAFVTQRLDQQHEEASCFPIATLSIFMLHQKHH